MLKLPFPHTNGTIIVNKSLPSSSIQVLTTVSRTEDSKDALIRAISPKKMLKLVYLKVSEPNNQTNKPCTSLINLTFRRPCNDIRVVDNCSFNGLTTPCF